ncbi:MAG TPA: hypothetical protein G4O12_09090 [Dehalococcoidia bacterium]|nr:hypothetical protein [Dehalococcoidia bacterium]
MSKLVIVKCDNGIEIKFEETPYYLTATVNGDVWYWKRDTGEFDGKAFDVE